jgi:hypothetical protein
MEAAMSRTWREIEQEAELARQRELDHASGYEEAIVYVVQEIVRLLLKVAGPWVWRWHDGEGGWLLECITQEAANLGYPVPRNRLSLPPVGPHRISIYERDAYRCRACGSWKDLQIDHIVPRSRGGTDDPDNLQVLCAQCNASKGARTMEEWIAERP